MGAGSASDAGPSTVSVKRTLSRSATFEVNEDEDLGPREKQETQTPKENPVKFDKQQILLGKICRPCAFLSDNQFDGFEKADVDTSVEFWFKMTRLNELERLATKIMEWAMWKISAVI
ncbi:hypothetical protein HDU77_011264 [Chytriomyces hyalinus]|nr:hypothetical protein HDU77_011264 [Chytriomyces hyalinus]